MTAGPGAGSEGEGEGEAVHAGAAEWAADTGEEADARASDLRGAGGEEPEAREPVGRSDRMPTKQPSISSACTGDPLGSFDYCSTSCPCEANEGDCDSDLQCVAGLACMRDTGALFGLDPELDTCMEQCSPDALGTPDFCSPECPCDAGEADCDDDEDCAPGNVCAKNAGAAFGYAPDVDVCVDACDTILNGTWDYCGPGCLCSGGQGDCDRHEDCATGYRCTKDVGAAYGFDPEMDVCEFDCSSSGSQCMPGRPFLADVVINRSYGTVNTVFELSGVSIPVGRGGAITDFQWTISDGRTSDTEAISLTFDQPGFYSITLVAGNAAGETSAVKVGIIVHDDGTPDVLSVPEPLADINRDGQITLVDAHLAAKFVGRLVSLPNDPKQEAADLDFDGDVTFTDVELIASAVLDNQPLPDRLLTDSGTPGTLVTLVSPLLLNPDDMVEIEIGSDNQRQSVIRPIMGYTSFVMPFTGAASLPGEQNVRLLLNREQVAGYKFTVYEAEPIYQDPVTELTAFLDELHQLMAINEQLVAEQIDAFALSDANRTALFALASAGRLAAEPVIAELEQVLAGNGGEGIAESFFIAANANGLSEYRSRLQSFIAAASQSDGTTLAMTLQAFTPDEVCGEFLSGFCALKLSSGLLSDAGDVIGIGCDILLAAGLGLIFVPADGPVGDAALLSTWASACAPLELALDVSAIFTDLISDIDVDLRLDVENNSPSAGESAIIQVALDVFGVDDVCRVASSAGADKLVEKLAEQAVGRLIRRKITVRAMTEIFTLLGEDYLQRFLGLLTDAASTVITASGLDEAIINFAQPYCEDIFGAELIMNASCALSGPLPDEGTLTFLSDGTAEYMCPDDPLSSGMSVSFTAEKEICEDVQTVTKEVQCKSRDVTIVMGDNGSANDDIFEVRVNGVTVLTASSPVRSISTTLQLPAGSISQVQMLGRAAPDGIGTYFIRFSGATVIAGDALSGSDLVPGAVKNFTIAVQPNN